MTIDVVRSGEVILCYVLRDGILPTATEFVTPPEVALQVGHIVHPRGHEILRHFHRPIERRITSTTELLLVKHGRCEIDIFDDSCRLVTTRELTSGDIVVLLACGHGFRMLEDTVLLEVKQGPYQGLQEKAQF